MSGATLTPDNDPGPGVAARSVGLAPVTRTINDEEQSRDVKPWTTLLDLLCEQLCSPAPRRAAATASAGPARR